MPAPGGCIFERLERINFNPTDLPDSKRESSGCADQSLLRLTLLATNSMLIDFELRMLVVSRNKLHYLPSLLYILTQN